MRRLALVLTVLLSVPLVGTCKDTKLVATVLSPTYSGQHFKKVLVIGLSNNPATRDDFEGAMSARLKSIGVHAVPGYNILLRPKDAKMIPDYLQEQIREHNIDAVLVTRLVSVQNNTTYIPGQAYTLPDPYYNSFWGYYNNVYPIVYTPGYLVHEEKVRVETTLYGTSTPDGEFIWTGLSETVDPNPKKIDKSIDAVVQVVMESLQKEKIF